MRLSPVVLPRIQASSCWRCGAGKLFPNNNNCCKLCAIDAGLAVSRTSPGMALLSSVSQRSSWNTVLPMLRANAVTACGPPNNVIKKLAALLSLYCKVAAHRSATLMPSARCFSVMGE